MSNLFGGEIPNRSGGDAAVGATADAVVAAIRKRQGEEAEACRRCGDAWERVARPRGFALADDREAGTRRAEGSVDDVDVEIAVVVDDEGWRHTLVTATPKVPCDVFVALRPSPKGIVSVMKAKLFGKPDIIIGDAEVDRRFLIHSEPKDVAAQMIDEGARSLLLKWCGNPLDAIEYDHGIVYVQSAGVETDATALDCALALAVRLAAYRPTPAGAYR